MKYLVLLILCALLINSCSFVKLNLIKKNELVTGYNSYQKFEFTNNKIFLSTLFPDNETYNMALDLGAGTSVLIKNSGLYLVDTLTPTLSFGHLYSATGDKIKPNYYKIGTVQTNSYKLENAFLPLFPDFQSSQCNKIVGLWGADLFDQKIIGLRMEDTTIAIFDSLPSLEGWTLLESEYEYPQFYLKVRIGDKVLKLKFDTGCSSGLVLSQDYYQKMFPDNSMTLGNINKWYGSAFVTVSGKSGADTTIQSTISQINLGQYTTDSIPILISNKIKHNVMGMKVFERFNFLLDYKNEKIYIQKNLNYVYTKSIKFLSQSGLSIRNTNENKAKIILLRINSPAEKSGLKLGDEIISINGIRTDSIEPCKIEDVYNGLDINRVDNEIIVKRGDAILKFIL